jgi:hypothetical protein
MFVEVQKVFTDYTMKVLSDYCDLYHADNKSSYRAWPEEATLEKNAPECFSQDVLGKDRMLILNELYYHRELPCAGNKWLMSADIAVQKLPHGGFIPMHQDNCRFSLTVFLSEVDGGEFVWMDGAHQYTVSPSINKGIYAMYDDFCIGPPHEVKTVQNESGRITLQLFVFDKSNSPSRVKWTENE